MTVDQVHRITNILEMALEEQKSGKPSISISTYQIGTLEYKIETEVLRVYNLGLVLYLLYMRDIPELNQDTIVKFAYVTVTHTISKIVPKQ